MAKLIYADKIYTCSFSSVNKHVGVHKQVSIAISQPKDFKGVRYTKLMPPWILLESYKNGNTTVEEYEEIYKEQILSQLNPIEVYEDLKGKVLCCWEGKTSFCHRKLVLDWLEKTIGADIIGGEL